MERGLRRKKEGEVVSDKMDKTVVVIVERKVLHRIYKKTISKRSKFVAHDPEVLSHVGDLVEISEVRPLSKTKRWRVTKVLRKAQQELV